MREGLTVDKALQKLGLSTERTVDPQQFRSMLKRASLQPDTLQKATDKTLLTNLIYYLAREEKQKVSIAKLRIALEMRETDQPLK